MHVSSFSLSLCLYLCLSLLLSVLSVAHFTWLSFSALLPVLADCAAHPFFGFGRQLITRRPTEKGVAHVAHAKTLNASSGEHARLYHTGVVDGTHTRTHLARPDSLMVISNGR